MTSTISTTAKKIIKAALTETNPNSIAAATSLTVQAVYANLNNLKKQNLANYDSDSKVLTLTAEGIRLANEAEAEVVEPVVASAEPTTTTINVVVHGVAKKKDTAWAIIEAMSVEGKSRKEIVLQIVTELGVNKNNASAYIQNYRKAHGLVTSRAATTEAEVGLGVDDVAEVETTESDATEDSTMD